MLLSRFIVFLCSFLGGLFSGCSNLPPVSPHADAAVTVGTVAGDGLTELSGMAPSLRESDVFWTHNDSGGAPEIFALNLRGETRANVAIDSATARDWEDIATFTWQGKPWILIADVGDNTATRYDLALYLLPEPALTSGATAQSLPAKVTYTLRFSFPDGPRDCEGVAVSPATNEILLISKRTEPPVLYSLRLPDLSTPSSATSQVATRLTALAGIIAPTAAERAIPGRLGQYRSHVTAFDLAPDGSAAAVLTYGNIWLYRRDPTESWATALTHAPERLPVRGLPQAEALSFSPDSQQLWLTTEATNAPIQRYYLP